MQIRASREGVRLPRNALRGRPAADADVLQVLRDQRDRGRDIDGIIKQWFTFVKPNFEKVSGPSVPRPLA